MSKTIVRNDFRLSAEQVLAVRMKLGEASEEFREQLQGPRHASFVDDVATGTGCEQDFETPARGGDVHKWPCKIR